MRLACIAVADARGRLLMVSRVVDASEEPVWSLPGGPLGEPVDQPGTDEPDAAVAAELLREQTGVRLAGPPALVRRFASRDRATGRDVTVDLFAADTPVGEAEPVPGDGWRVALVDPATVHAVRLDRVATTALPAVLGRPAYRDRFADPDRAPLRFGTVIVVDDRGHVLLQERDEHAPIEPDRWGLCGGHLEPGEGFREGALRELEEETGLRLPPDAVQRVGSFPVWHPTYASLDVMEVYAARLSLTDADIDCREGRRIVFVDPDVALALDLTGAALAGVPAFLASDVYARMGPWPRPT